MRSRRGVALFAAGIVALASVAAAVAACGASPAHARSPLPGAKVVLLGHSVKGRAVRALRLGDRGAARKALVVGVIHGDETAGLKVVRTLRRRFAHLRGVDLWTVYTVNPDGLARGSRRNAHGVDLNRNFSFRWAPSSPSSGYYGGRRPFSEPESRLVRRLIRRLHPAVTIWYHQPWGQVLAPCHGDARLERRYSRISGIPMQRCRGDNLPGTATSWQERHFPRTKAFVVELPGGRIGAALARRNARAAATVAVHGVTTAIDRRSGSLRAIKPRIHDWLIPYGRKRRHQMAAYSKRHYGQREWRLKRVEQIVEHLSVTPTARAVYNTFAPDVPDAEYGELPGVCSHYVIGRSGRIFRFVHLTTRCRHVVGLNYISVGIEHVGYTERDVLTHPKQLRASLRLTRWLRYRFNLRVKRVIGHAESLSSPFYRELDPRFKGRTHGDWRHRYMQRYRRKLRALGGCPR